MTTTLSTSTHWPTEALPKKWIDDLFDRMLMTFGKRFSDQWQGTDPQKLKEFWGTRMATLTSVEMRSGVEAMLKLKWPPTLNEFIELCRPSLDMTVAYYEAVNGMEARRKGEKGEWSHPAIFWAASKMTHDLLNQTCSNIKTRWENALSKELQKNGWPDIPAVMEALPAPGKTETDKERASRELENLNASGILKKQPGLAWAKKIMARKANGETLPAISVNWAQEAIKGTA